LVRDGNCHRSVSPVQNRYRPGLFANCSTRALAIDFCQRFGTLFRSKTLRNLVINAGNLSDTHRSIGMQPHPEGALSRTYRCPELVRGSPDRGLRSASTAILFCSHSDTSRLYIGSRATSCGTSTRLPASGRRTYLPTGRVSITGRQHLGTRLPSGLYAREVGLEHSWTGLQVGRSWDVTVAPGFDFVDSKWPSVVRSSSITADTAIIERLSGSAARKSAPRRQQRPLECAEDRYAMCRRG